MNIWDIIIKAMTEDKTVDFSECKTVAEVIETSIKSIIRINNCLQARHYDGILISRGAKDECLLGVQ
jgi:hypothetical protein